MRRPKIVIVEDDQDLREGVRIGLGQSYDTMVADDAWSAIAVIEQERPDVVLLDLGLSAASGYTVLDHLQRTPSLAGLPVVVVTGRDPRFNRDLCLEMGAVAFLEKPFENAALMQALDDALDAAAAGGAGGSPS